ncbi:unnamed protein product [Sphagnum balticum]
MKLLYTVEIWNRDYGLCNQRDQAGYGKKSSFGTARAVLGVMTSSRGHRDDDPLCGLLRGVEKTQEVTRHQDGTCYWSCIGEGSAAKVFHPRSIEQNAPPRVLTHRFLLYAAQEIALCKAPSNCTLLLHRGCCATQQPPVQLPSETQYDSSAPMNWFTLVTYISCNIPTSL